MKVTDRNFEINEIFSSGSDSIFLLIVKVRNIETTSDFYTKA